MGERRWRLEVIMADGLEVYCEWVGESAEAFVASLGGQYVVLESADMAGAKVVVNMAQVQYIEITEKKESKAWRQR